MYLLSLIFVLLLESCVLIQLLHVKQQYHRYGAGDAAIGEVKHRPKEQHFARAVSDEREVEHIYHFAVEPVCVTEEFAVEHAIDDVSYRPGDDEGNGGDIAGLGVMPVDQRVDVPSEQTYRQESKERQR